jgi:type I restriction enzyme S subunit
MTWASMRWQDVCILKYGKALKDYKHFNQAYPVYGSGGVVGSTDTPIAPGERVIVSRKGTLTAYWSSAPSHVIDTAFWLEPNPVLDAKWSYYAIKNLDISTLSSGSGVPSLSRDDFYREELLLPPLKQQKAIAHILGTLDDKIELNQKMNQTLEEIAKAIFKSWFVDFDPVRAKAESRPTGLPSEISDLFPDELVDSEIGEIPKGWEVKTISDLADCLGGATPSTKNPDFWDGGHLSWTSPKDLSKLESIHLLKTDRKITESGLKKISSGLLPVGTVLLSSRAPVGYLALTTEPTAINQGYIALKPVSGVSNYFLLNWCDSNLEQIKNRASGTTFAEISKAAFRPIPAVSPSRELMTKFHEFVEPIYERVLCASKEVETLSDLRDTLLPKLISGELRIPDAEKFLDEAGI